MVCEGAAGDWSAVYLRTTLRVSPGLAGTGYAIFAAAMLLVRLAGDRLLHRYAPRALLPALASVATVGMASALLSGAPAVALIGLGTLGLGVGLIVPAVYSAAGRLPAIATGQAIAVVSAIGWIGFVGGPPVIGRVAQLTSLPVALGLLPILTVAIGATVAITGVFKVQSARDS